MSGRMRSPNYPAIGLTDAILIARAIWEKEKRTVVTMDVLAKAIGYGSLSGPARIKIAALRQYGLLDKGKGGLRLSDLAVRLMHSEQESPDSKEAIRVAALTPGIFRELYETHLDASDPAIKSHLIVKKDFSETGANILIKAFRDVLAVANLQDSSYSPNSPENESNAMPQQPSVPSSVGQQPTTMGQKQNVRTYSWPLSDKVVGELRLFGEDITAEHIDFIEQYLKIVKAALKKDRSK